MKNETDLRRFYKEIFNKDDLIWVEPSFGSSVGVPDLFHPVKGSFVPIEFKFFKKGKKVEFRRQQVRFHLTHAIGERKTLCVCGFETGCEKQPFDILIFRGGFIVDVLGLSYEELSSHRAVCSLALDCRDGFKADFLVVMDLFFKYDYSEEATYRL